MKQNLKSEIGMSKQCSKCKRFLPLFYFQKDNRLKDGYRQPCKECLGIDIQIAYKRAERPELLEKGLNRCYCCKEVKPIDSFIKTKNLCKDCQSLKNADRDRTVEYKKRNQKRRQEKWDRSQLKLLKE